MDTFRLPCVTVVGQSLGRRALVFAQLSGNDSAL